MLFSYYLLNRYCLLKEVEMKKMFVCFHLKNKNRFIFYIILKNIIFIITNIPYIQFKPFFRILNNLINLIETMFSFMQ